MSASLSPEERQLYPIALYTLVWPLLYLVGIRWFYPPFGMAIAAFIWLFGLRFLPPRARRERVSLAKWLAISAVIAAAGFVIRFTLDAWLGA